MNLHLYTIFKFPYAILSNNGQHQNKRKKQLTEDVVLHPYSKRRF